MGLYKNKINPATGQLNLVPTATIITFKATVASASNLPLSGNTLNDGRITTDNGHLHVWDGTQWVDQGDMMDVVASGVTNDSTVAGTTVKDALENLYGFGTPEDIRYIDDNTGDDINGNGSFQKPYKSLQRAVADFGPNDYCTFYIYPGSYNDLTPINFPENGTIFGFGGQITNIAAPLNIISNGLSQTIIFFQNVSFTNTITIDLSLSFFGVISLFGGSFNINRLDSSFALVTIQGGSSGTYRGKITFNGGAVVNAPITVEAGSNIDMLNMSFIEKVVLKGDAVLKTVNCTNLFPFPIVEGIIEGGNTPTWYTDAISDLGYIGDVNKVYLDTSSTTQNLSDIPVATVTLAINYLYNTITEIADDVKNNTLNIMLNAFRIAQIGSLTIFNMVKGIMDEYEDESGVDLPECINQEYNAIDDYYTVPVTYDSYTKLMLHLNDDYVDVATAKAITDSGASFISGIFDSGITFTPSGTAYIYSGASSDFNFGSGDWTVEFWFRMSNTNSKFKLGLGSSSFWQIEYGETGPGFTFQPGLGYGYAIGHSFSEITSWHHLALVRNGDVHTLYIDGTAVGSPWTNSDASTANGTTGGTNSGGGFELMNYAGTAVKFDEVRISKGIARWTANFTPPIEAYAPNTTPPNLTLVSKTTIAQDIPTSARIILFEEDVDAVTLNTDLKVFISRDDGTTWTEAVLEDEGNYITGARILSAVVDLSTQPSGTDIRYKITITNNKNLKIHGTSVSWK